ncbi:MAG: hypothetical protein ACM3RP_00080 [Chitinophagales bacterium]
MNSLGNFVWPFMVLFLTDRLGLPSPTGAAAGSAMRGGLWLRERAAGASVAVDSRPSAG